MKVEVEQLKLPDTCKNIWGILEKRSTKYIDKYRKQKTAKINVPENKWILLCFVGDIHLGNIGTNYALARKHAEMIGQCEYAIALGGGDYIDNFIKSKILSALIEQITTPKEQMKLLSEYLGFFNDKMYIAVSGNHDNWTKEVSGIDALKGIIQNKNIIYSSDVITIDLLLNGVKYTIKMRHKFNMNSRYNASHSVKQMLRFGDELFDIGAVFHHHEPTIEQTYLLGEDRVFLRTGSYKEADSYSRREGWNSHKTVMPCVIVSPKERKMFGLWDLEEGINFVNYKNQG